MEKKHKGREEVKKRNNEKKGGKAQERGREKENVRKGL